MPPKTMSKISPVLSAPFVPPTFRMHPALANISRSIPHVVPPRLSIKQISSQSVSPRVYVSDELVALLDVAVASFDQS
jgi:hypothetical protein